MVAPHWLRSLFPQPSDLSRQKRRWLSSRLRRKRRGGRGVLVVEALESRTLLAATNPLPLSSLNGTTGFRLDGVAAGDNSGFSVSSAGDVNGDGFDDLLLGAYGADPNGVSSSGSSYVVFGKSGGFTSAINLSSLNGTTGFRIDGVAADDQAGRSVSSAGDVNGDGFDDLLVGAAVADPNSVFNSGSSYVVFGKSGGFASAINLSTLNGTTGFRLDGVAASDFSGVSVSGAGDVNGDGFGDLIVGAHLADPNGMGNAGSSYVVFGKSGGFASAINLSSLNGTTGFRLDGVAADDQSGRSVSSAGDVNGDGFDDLIVGAFGADPNSVSYSGSSYVVFGKSGGFASAIILSSLNGTTGFRLDGVTANDRSSYSVSGAGDVNGDGFDDLIVGAYLADPNSVGNGGSSYVVFGKSGGFASAINLSSLNGTTGFRLDGVAFSDFSGRSVSGAGDVNGDGFDDLLVGAHLADPNGLGNAGSSYVIFGGNFTGGAETQVGGGGGQTLTANQGAGARDVLIGGRGNDTLISDGGSDVLRGGEGNDILAVPDAGFSGTRRIVGGTGSDTLRLDGSGITLDLTAIADNRITGIEQIDITGSGDNTLRLTAREVLNLSGSSNTLTVRGNAGDQVTFLDGSWANQGVVNIGGTDFRQFTSGAATLNIQLSVQAALQFISLSSLNGTNGFRLDGVAAYDSSGISVSSAGDVNGDGFEDVLVGAYRAAPNGNSQAGSTYVVFGKSGGFASAVNLSTLNGTTGFRLDGVALSDRSGGSVSRAGDVNGDGFDDLLVGASLADPNVTNSGSSYVVFGKSGGFASAINLSTLDGATGFRLDGVATGDFSGSSVSGAGDINGDGFDDLLVGAYGADPNGDTSGSSYVVFGKSGGFASVINLSTLDGTTGFRLDGAANERSGRRISGAGDVNGDGFEDLLVGAYQAAPNGNTQAGSSYVVFGKSGGFASAINLSTLNGTNGFRVNGVAVGDFSGRAVSGAGDVNGDGFDDLLIGARSADPNGSESGSSYVVFGKSGGFASAINLSTLNGTTGFRLDGVAAGDISGASVSRVGDVNGDGFDDLLIGAWGADPNGTGSGASYVVFGKSGGFASAINLSSLNGTTGFRLDGVAAGDYSGISVSGAGDVNGDGFDDLIVGAHWADPNGSRSGSSYVIFGGNFTGGAETQVGGDGAQTLTAAQGASAIDILIGGRGGDTLVSDGGPDVLIGGEGDDILAVPDADFSGTRRLVGGTGTDTLRLDGSGVTLDLTAIADNRITGIEVIDLSGSGANILRLNAQEILNLSGSSNTLLVYRDADDDLMIGSGWTEQAPETIGPDTFRVLTQGAATLKYIPRTFSPVLAASAGDVSFTEAGAAVVLFADGTVSDVDAPADFDTGKLTLKLAGNREKDDRLGFDTSGPISVSGNEVRHNGTPIGTFTGTSKVVVTLNTSATPARVQDLLRSVTYSSDSTAIKLSPKTVTAKLTDGDGGASNELLRMVTITSLNNAPVIAGFDGVTTYTEDKAPALVDSNALVTDGDELDFDGGTLTVSLTANAEADDRLAIRDQGAGTNKITVAGDKVSYNNVEIGSFSGGTDGFTPLVVTFNASATATAVRAVLRNVTFENVSQNPSAATRTVEAVLTDGDGGTSNTASKSIEVVPKNDAPEISGFAGTTTYDTGTGDPVFVDTDAVVTDVDSADFDGGRLTFKIIANKEGTDLFEIQNVGLITVSGNQVSYNGTVIGTFSGTSTLSIQLNAAADATAVTALVRAVTGHSTSATPSLLPRTVRLTMQDGDGGTTNADKTIGFI